MSVSVEWAAGLGQPGMGGEEKKETIFEILCLWRLFSSEPTS